MPDQNIILPLISGFVGALIGAFSSIATVYIQSKISDKRTRHQQIIDLAVRDHEFKCEVLKQKYAGKSLTLPPLVIFINYHQKLMKLLEKDKLTPENVEKIMEENRSLIKKISEISKNDQ